MTKVNLFSGYFPNHPNPERQEEIDRCLEFNVRNKHIDEVITFSGRPRYSDFFKQTQQRPDDVNILANADIYFDDTLELIHTIKAKEAYAITRWEIDGRSIVPFEVKHTYNKEAKARHSQDVWVFRGSVTRVLGNFYLGIPGCDNRIAADISRAGYSLYNPCMSIKCIHIHEEQERNYTVPEDSPSQVGKPWKWVDPCRITPAGGYILERNIRSATRRAI